MSFLLVAACALAYGVMSPPRHSSDGTGTSGRRAAPAMYLVAQGDTVDGIGARFGVSKNALIRANHLTNADVIEAGQTLVIPGPRRQLPTEIDGAPATRRMIVAAAHRFGIDPALALAVAWQESRLRQNRRSSTGALGIMQVEPPTAVMAMRQLGHALSIRRPADNVTAGVYWLSHLLRAYRGNQSLAAAAYYEGQGNLARYGLLPGVQTYVASVLATRNLLSGS